MQWVILFAFLGTGVSVAVGTVRYSRLSAVLRTVYWFCVVSLGLDMITRVFWVMKASNLFIGHLNTPVEFVFSLNY